MRIERRSLILVLAVTVAISAKAYFSAKSAASRRLSSKSDATLEVDWSSASEIKTKLSLQVVVHPMLARKQADSKNEFQRRAWKSLKELEAEEVRFVPWQSYPELAVPQYVEGKWDFSKIDPLVADFMEAMEDRPVTFDFSTIPLWMFDDVPKKSWVWYGGDGHHLRDSTYQELAGYYGHLMDHYAELGYRIHTFEFLNETNWEHGFTKREYTSMYDAVVSRLRLSDPKKDDESARMRFMGVSHGRPAEELEFYRYFLVPSNHRVDVPIDAVSFHFYAKANYAEPSDAKLAEWAESYRDQIDRFLPTIDKIEGYAQAYAAASGHPKPRLALNEFGTLLKNEKDRDEGSIPPARYWNLSAAMQSYAFIRLIERGTEFLGMSQLLGSPGGYPRESSKAEFPSVSLLDWRTGKPNARLRALKLLWDNVKPGARWSQVRVSEGARGKVAAIAVSSGLGVRKLVLVNLSEEPIQLALPGGGGGTQWSVDVVTGDGEASRAKVLGAVRLQGFAVSVIEL